MQPSDSEDKKVSSYCCSIKITYRRDCDINSGKLDLATCHMYFGVPLLEFYHQRHRMYHWGLVHQ